MDLLELIQRDIDEIAEWGHCNFAETFKTLILAKEEIENLRSKVNNGVLDDVSNSNEQKPIKYQCLFCNRSFKRRIPHNCKGGFRKRKIEWLPIYE